MALKGLDIFKLTPKTNCKDCGNPTCMAFAMKVAQGALSIDKCPHMSAEALKTLGEASEPPMKLISIGAGESKHSLGGETVLFRHEKTFVSETLYGVTLGADNADNADTVIEAVKKIDYERIGERMYVELLNVEYGGKPCLRFKRGDSASPRIGDGHFKTHRGFNLRRFIWRLKDSIFSS